MPSAPTQCPSCRAALTVTELCCEECGTKVQGRFGACPYCALGDDGRRFLDSFIRCRGVIKEIEADLGISYPTVKSRMQALLRALGFEAPLPDRRARQREVLEALERGEIGPDEAQRRLQTLE